MIAFDIRNSPYESGIWSLPEGQAICLARLDRDLDRANAPLVAESHAMALVLTLELAVANRGLEGT